MYSWISTTMTIKFAEWIIYLFFLTLQVDIGNSVPFKIVPSHTNALGPASLPLLETVFQFVLCKHLQCLHHNSFNIFYIPQWTFFNAFLTFGNGEKSYKAISCEYGECNIWVLPFLANQSATTCDVCGGALSWWSTQLLAENGSDLMWAIQARNRFRILR